MKSKIIKRCNLCNNTEFERIFIGHDMLYNIRRKYGVYKCKECNLKFLNPQPMDLSKHYPKEKYYSLQSDTQYSGLRQLLDDIYYYNKGNWFLRILFYPLKTTMRTMKIIPNGRVLDVGCGAGHFLKILKDKGMVCYGIEPQKFNKRIAKENNFNIINKTLLDAKFPNEYFDMITMNHVMEHVSNPNEIFKELYRILKQNGTFIMAVPQSRNLAYWIFKKYWISVDIPRHLYIFSIKHLKRYIDMNNFKIIKTRYISAPIQFSGSFLYFLNTFKKKKLYLTKNNFTRNKFIYIMLFPISFLCNLFRIGDEVELHLIKS